MPQRKTVLAVALAAGLGVIGILTVLLPANGTLAVLLLDRSSSIFLYPFTMQNLMYVVFFLGLGELYLRRLATQREEAILGRALLPEDDETVLQAHDLGPIRERVIGSYDAEHGFLPSLIDLCILQFMTARSVSETVSILNSSLELIGQRVDLRYTWLRYIVWAIPTFGFIGTVVGIAAALAVVGVDGDPDLKEVAGALAIAFNTTIVALVLSAVLVFALHLVQAREERAVNRAGDYCLRNLVNRLYVAGPQAAGLRQPGLRGRP